MEKLHWEAQGVAVTNLLQTLSHVVGGVVNQPTECSQLPSVVLISLWRLPRRVLGAGGLSKEARGQLAC